MRNAMLKPIWLSILAKEETRLKGRPEAWVGVEAGTG